jgi:hypothetical protein
MGRTFVRPEARVVLGRDLVVIERGTDRLCLEGSARLRPGQRLTLIGDGRAPGGTRSFSATVVSWSVCTLGPQGPKYRGVCHVDATAGNTYPPEAS